MTSSDSHQPKSWMSDPIGRPNRAVSPKSPSTPSPPTAEVGAALPSIIVAPAHPIPSAGVEIELAKLESGEPVAVVYSTVKLLVAQLGKSQPWMALPSDSLVALVAAKQITGIVLDPTKPVSAPAWSSQRVQLLTEVLDGRL